MSQAKFDISSLVGIKVRGSTALASAPRDRVIAKVWQSETDGSYIAWSAEASDPTRSRGEHLRASSEDALRRRVMSLA